MSNKKKYLLWSGGLDSTYLIQKLLSEDPEVHVCAGYVQIKNNADKVTRELAAINKLEMVLKNVPEFLNRFQYLGIVMDINVRWLSNNSNFHQLPIWLNALASTTPEDVSEICLGYIRNDDAISYLNEIKHTWQSYKKIDCTKNIKLSFPLSKLGKGDIIELIQPELLQHVTWCETGPREDRLCDSQNSCHPCERIRPFHNRIMSRISHLQPYTPSVQVDVGHGVDHVVGHVTKEVTCEN